MTGKDILPEKVLLEKAAALKRFEYSPLGKELKEETSAAEKQYHKSNLVYDTDFNFYHNIKEFVKRSFYSKLNYLIGF